MTDHVSILCDIACELGEGPSYDPETNRLFWFDITGERLLERSFPDGDTVVHALPFMASAIAVVDADRQLIAAENGLHVRDAASGALSLLQPIEADNALTRSNDSRVHPCGAFWIGTMAKDESRDLGAIYWFFRGELRTLYRPLSIPNSICFSPDGRIGYFTDTPRGLLYRVDCDPETGLPVGEPAVFVDWRGRDGFIDGSVVDADGVLWNARWAGGAVDAWAPDGRRLRTIAVPAAQATCPAFAGPDASRLVVTSAWKGRSERQRDAEPDAGKTFLIDRPVRGRFEPRVKIA